MISQSAIEKILGIDERVYMDPMGMAKRLKISFYPYTGKASDKLREFSSNLEDALRRIGVEIVPYESIYERRAFSRRCRRFFRFLVFNGVWICRKMLGMNEISSYIPFSSILELSGPKKIKKGISIVCVGEQEASRLMMQYISNFKDNSIITIIDIPEGINRDTDFRTHFDTAMKLFAYHMTNIIIGVSDVDWMVYNFNASHPIYSLGDGKFDEHILKALIPKIVAPISPHKLDEFEILSEAFDPEDVLHRPIVREMQEGAILFDQTNLYPKGKKIDELPFRHPFHRLIGKLHLDNRNGMSFGYLAFQMKAELSTPIPYDEFTKKYSEAFGETDIFVEPDTRFLFVACIVNKRKIVLKVPDVWVMTIRSGADKTHFNPEVDLLKIGLVNGKMMMQLPKGLKIHKDYKPSFDTKVILAHAVGNALVGSIISIYDNKHQFVLSLTEKGLSISHWHGYFNRTLLQKGVSVYGGENLHVSCSSPQSAVYALDGKLKSFSDKIRKSELSEYRGDIHIEPHHGINITFPSLIELAQYILDNPEATSLGNKYL
jgi:hypothetical protein